MTFLQLFPAVHHWNYTDHRREATGENPEPGQTEEQAELPAEHSCAGVHTPVTQMHTALVCRCSQDRATGAEAPEGTGKIWNLGRKSYCHCRQPQALSIFLYLTNCSSEPELFRADSSDSSLEQGGHIHRWRLQFSPAQAYPDPQGGLAGQLAQFVKQAGGSEVEHTVLGTQRAWNQPLSSGCAQNRGC